MGNLSAVGVQSLKKPGRYYDGQNLALEVGPGGGKAWSFLYMRDRKTRQMGMGPYPTVSLAKAREWATEYRLVLLKGGDPFQHRDGRRAASSTFDECAKAYIEAHRSKWKKSKQAKLWTNTLETYASPILGKLAVRSITNNDVVKVLQPIWETLPETASRVRGRIETVLDWARVRGFREGENPARRKGNLDHLLPPRAKISKVRHHPALPFVELPTFLADLRKRAGVAPLAFRFMILTATRTSEVTGARWSEISIAEKLWTIPAERMKSDREHRVTISSQALAILSSLDRPKGDDNAFVFAGAHGRALSNMAFLACLKRMERTDITPHGMRSTFRDWVSEQTDHSSEVAEMALAHVIPSKVESAYRRGDLLAKRKALMDDWSTFCEG